MDPKYLSNQNLRNEFDRAYTIATDEGLVGLAATGITVRGNSVNFGVLSHVGKMKKHQSKYEAVEFNKLVSKAVDLPVEDYSTGMEIHQYELDDDQTGMIMPRLRTLAAEANDNRVRLVIDVIKNGFGTTKTGVDGKALFATDHLAEEANSAGSQTNSNMGTGALSKATLNAAFSALRKQVDGQGRRVNRAPMFTLVVPTELEVTARELVNAQLVGGGNTNVQRGSAEVYVAADLTDANDWFVFVRNAPLKAAILADRMPVKFTPERPDAGTNFETNSRRFKVEYRGVAGVGRYQSAYGAQVS